MFITFEGPDGSGKTTQIAQISEILRKRGYNILLTREPGGTDIGDQIRDVLHNLENESMNPRAELLLYNASRAQIVAEVIKPHLAAGGLILCDRFFDSTLAYQGYGHGLDLNTLRTIIDFATGGLRPDLTFYLDISAEAGIQRRLSALDKGGEWTRLDAMGEAFHNRVRDGYHQLIATEPGRWVTINAAQPVEKVQTDILATLDTRLKNNSGRDDT
ncbi:MAG: dTMP kinase [Chloroflexota bacterium]